MKLWQPTPIPSMLLRRKEEPFCAHLRIMSMILFTPEYLFTCLHILHTLHVHTSVQAGFLQDYRGSHESIVGKHTRTRQFQGNGYFATSPSFSNSRSHRSPKFIHHVGEGRNELGDHIDPGGVLERYCDVIQIGLDDERTLRQRIWRRLYG